MQCSNCQNKITPDWNFCSKCGNQVEIVIPSVATQRQRIVNYLMDRIAVFVIVVSYYFVTRDATQAIVLDSVLLFFYYLVFEYIGNRTLGKLLTNTKVVSESSRRPSFLSIFLRSLCRFVPFEMFSFGGKQPLGWHDRWSKTAVVATSLPVESLKEINFVRLKKQTRFLHTTLECVVLFVLVLFVSLATTLILRQSGSRQFSSISGPIAARCPGYDRDCLEELRKEHLRARGIRPFGE